MKKIIIILVLIGSASLVRGQSLNPFPSTDSLRKFVNKWIRNSAVDAFTNLRLNTSLIGMTRFLDSAYGGQVSGFTYSTDTIRLALLSGDTLKIALPSATGNTNLGTGFRLLVPSSQGLKTIFAGNTVLIDSTSNTNGLTFKVDTTVIATVYDLSLKADQQALEDTAAALRAAIGSGGTPPGTDQDVIINNAGVFGVAGTVKINPTQNKLTADSLATIKLRASQVSFNPLDAITQFNADSFVVSGHSIMHGANAYPLFGFAYLIGEFLGLPVSNLGVPSTGDVTAVNKLLKHINPGHNALTGIMPSLNDWRRRNVNHAATGYRTRAKHYNTLLSVFWNAQAKNNINPTNGDGISKSGTWSDNWSDGTVPNKNTTLGSYTNQNGAYIEWGFTDTTAGFRLIGGDSSSSAFLTAIVKVEIDGTPVDTINTNQSDGEDDTGDLLYRYIPITRIYPGLGPGSHTIRLTNLSSDYLLVDGFFSLIDASEAKWQLWFHEPHMQMAAYTATQLTIAKTDEMNARTDSLRQTIFEPYRSKIIIINVNSPGGYDTVNTNDGIHPDTVGHAQIADYAIGRFTRAYNDPSIIYDSVNQKYTGFRDGKPYALAYEVDILNRINEVVDNNGNGLVGGSGSTNTLPKWSGATRILTNSNITDNGSIVTINGTTIMNGAVNFQGSGTAGFNVYGRGDNQGKFGIYSPGTAGDLRFFNLLGTQLDRFAFTQLGTFKIGTSANSTNIDSRGFYNNRSTGYNKDSIPIISSVSSEYLLVLDTLTGQQKRMLPFSGSGLPASITTYTSNTTATVGDLDSYVFLSGASGTTDYDINPATFTGKTLIIKCIDATNTVKITLASGTIDGYAELELLLNESVWVTSDGTNLFIVK